LVLRGAYLAQTYCASCHGDNLRGGVTADTVNCPALSAVAAYSNGQFKALLTDGVERDGAPLNRLMVVPLSLTEQDREALQAYLHLLFETR
jgi:mono/diheme cytochrome c family protein